MAYPGYQPEVVYRPKENTYETESRVNYLDPKLKLFPIYFDRLIRD